MEESPFFINKAKFRVARRGPERLFFCSLEPGVYRQRRTAVVCLFYMNLMCCHRPEEGPAFCCLLLTGERRKEGEVGDERDDRRDHQ